VRGVVQGGSTQTAKSKPAITDREVTRYPSRETRALPPAVHVIDCGIVYPLRRRIQSFIDRSFYRSKYDARKTLEAFSTQLRNETDLDALGEDLVSVVKEMMQPAHVTF